MLANISWGWLLFPSAAFCLCFFVFFLAVVVMLSQRDGPPCKRPSPAPNPCLSDTQHRSSGSKHHHHSTRSPSVLCFCCFRCCFSCCCCCYSYFSSLGISRPVNLASLSVVRFGALLFFLFLLSSPPFPFVSASCLPSASIYTYVHSSSLSVSLAN